MAPTQQQQSAVAAYFTEAGAPTVIGTAEAGQHILETVTNVGRVLEQIGRSRRLLNLAKLAEPDAGFQQDADGIAQPLAAVARDCEEIQRLLMQLARHSAAIDAGNAKAKATALGLGYTV